MSNLNNKAFFSVAILVFAFLIFMLFVDYKQDSKKIEFDDSPRLFALKMEEAYNILDKKLSYSYIDYKINIAKDCNAKTSDILGYFNYIEPTTKLNEYCDYYGIAPPIGTYTPIFNQLDVNYTFVIRCTYSAEEDISKRFTSNQTITFHKRYQSYLVVGNKCQYVLSDLDTMSQYFGLIK